MELDSLEHLRLLVEQFQGSQPAMEVQKTT